MVRFTDLGRIRPGHPMWTDGWVINIGGRWGERIPENSNSQEMRESTGSDPNPVAPSEQSTSAKKP